MGNAIGLGRRKVAKVMKINGETMKFKTPIHAKEVIENHPGHVLLESESVKHYGIRARPLQPCQELKPRRLYFLVELPELIPQEQIPRRVRSVVHMTAKDRLESLMLARRSVSDLTILKPTSSMAMEEEEAAAKESSSQKGNGTGTGRRLKMRIPKSEVEKIMNQCQDEDEVAAKLLEFCMEKHPDQVSLDAQGDNSLQQNNVPWKQVQENEPIPKRDLLKPREKRVGFHPVTSSEIQLAVQ